MDARELGLILSHHLFGLDDLHYGLWDELDVSLPNLPLAQRRLTELVLSNFPALGGEGAPSVLDVGCGTGWMMGELAERGYRVAGVSPAASLNEIIKARLSGHGAREARVFECRFEDLPAPAEYYDVVLFSESFQFIDTATALNRTLKMLKPGGRLIICDVFRTSAEGDGGPGDGVIRGGHGLSKFHRLVGQTPLRVTRDEDITQRVSPTIALLGEVLKDRVEPALDSITRFVRHQYSWLAWAVMRLKGRRLARTRQRHLGGYYTQETFERYKSYRHLVYTLD